MYDTVTTNLLSMQRTQTNINKICVHIQYHPNHDMQRTQIIKNKNCVHIQCHQNNGMQRTQTINLCQHMTHNAIRTTICDGHRLSMTKSVSTYDTQHLQTKHHLTTIHDDDVQGTMRHRACHNQLQVTPTSEVQRTG